MPWLFGLSAKVVLTPPLTGLAGWLAGWHIRCFHLDFYVLHQVDERKDVSLSLCLLCYVSTLTCSLALSHSLIHFHFHNFNMEKYSCLLLHPVCFPFVVNHLPHNGSVYVCVFGVHLFATIKCACPLACSFVRVLCDLMSVYTKKQQLTVGIHLMPLLFIHEN